MQSLLHPRAPCGCIRPWNVKKFNLFSATERNIGPPPLLDRPSAPPDALPAFRPMTRLEEEISQSKMWTRKTTGLTIIFRKYNKNSRERRAGADRSSRKRKPLIQRNCIFINQTFRTNIFQTIWLWLLFFKKSSFLTPVTQITDPTIEVADPQDLTSLRAQPATGNDAKPLSSSNPITYLPNIHVAKLTSSDLPTLLHPSSVRSTSSHFLNTFPEQTLRNLLSSCLQTCPAHRSFP